MAFVVKQRRANQGNSDGTAPILDQWVHVVRPAENFEQTASTNNPLFQIIGGKVWVKAMIGTVMTAVSGGTTPDLQIEFVDDITTNAIDVASDVAITADAVGNVYHVEGDGTALVSNVNAYVIGTAVGDGFVVGPGTLDEELTESTITGQVKWDLWYVPLEPAAYVIAR